MDAVEEGWEQTLFFVLNGITSQMMHTSAKSPRGAGLCMFKMICVREGENGDGDGDKEGPGSWTVKQDRAV